MKLLLLRHGETDSNVAKRFQGQSDTPLTPKGIEQARAAARHFAGVDIAAVYTSDLRRALETARLAAPMAAKTDPRLREINFGEWEGLTYAEIQERFSGELTAWEANPLLVGPPKGESLSALAARAEDFLNFLRENHADQTVLLVAHGGILQTILCVCLGLSPEMYWQFRLEPAGLAEISLYPAGAILNRLNQTPA